MQLDDVITLVQSQMSTLQIPSLIALASWETPVQYRLLVILFHPWRSSKSFFEELGSNVLFMNHALNCFSHQGKRIRRHVVSKPSCFTLLSMFRWALEVGTGRLLL